MTERIRLLRDELLSDRVSDEIEKARQLSGRIHIETEPLSPARRLFMNSMFYLPLAGVLAALLSWLVLEPGFHDFEIIGGEIVLRNDEPFEGYGSHGVSLTVGTKEVIVHREDVLLEPGADGQDPFPSVDVIRPGVVLEVSGQALSMNRMAAIALRPATEERARRTGQTIIGEISVSRVLLFPLTAVLIVFALIVAEGIASRNVPRMIERSLLGTLLTLVFSFVAFVPAGIVITLGQAVVDSTVDTVFTVHTMPGPALVIYSACRSAAWASIGAAMGLGMNLARSTKIQLRNSVVGGALGGALGGMFFDPIGRFLTPDTAFVGAGASRLVGLLAVGGCVGVFVALVDRLAREAWVRVRTGPLAGKSFVLYKTPTVLGSSPSADVYLMKDPGVDPSHAAVHRVGSNFEIEDMGSREGIRVEGRSVLRHRLTSGEQIQLGGTVLEFEERRKGTTD